MSINNMPSRKFRRTFIVKKVKISSVRKIIGAGE
jgi:hypothetical protein